MVESNRTASVERNTSETKIKLKLDVDGSAISNIQTGIPFFDHMLVQIAKHGMLDLDVYAEGDIEVDAHHTVEDVGIVFGQALAKAMEDKSGIYRYGHASVPLDEALSRVVIDLSGRPGLFYEVQYARARV